MKEADEKLVTIGELAKRIGITVRTLQYYDRSKLLVPKYSVGGRRMYDKSDIIKLQQILFLKSFGLSLSEIRDKLLPSESTEELESILIRQKNILTHQIANLNKTVDMIDKAICQINSDKDIKIDKLMMIMELLKQKNPYLFIISRYFGNEEVKRLMNWLNNSKNTSEFTNNFQSILKEAFELYKKGVDPTGIEGQKLASKWWTIVMSFTQNDPKLLNTLMSAGLDVDNWPDEVKEFKQVIKMFLSKALSAYLSNNKK